MDQILANNAVYLYYGFIISISCALLLVVYVLNDSTHPPAGLGVYAAYFVASLLCWLAITAQLGSGMAKFIDLANLATIIPSYILFFAAGQRLGAARGRLFLGALCLLAVLSSFFLEPKQMLFVESIAVGIFSLATGVLTFLRARRERSLGDAMIGSAAVLVIIGIGVANYQFAFDHDVAGAHMIMYVVYSSAYALVVMGFIASVLAEYQHHLMQLATEDPHTRLLNRRGMAEALNVSLATAARQGLSTSAVMVDIDHFKKVNDNFGQETGDHVIQQIAEILNRMARASDVIARIGGEEYLLVLPDTPLEPAKVLAERIRATIDENPLLVHRQTIHITVSIGVACIDGAVNLDELSQGADRAMYLAKRGGRNRVATLEHKPVKMTSGSPGA